MNIILTTCASKKEAEHIAEILVKEKLCACVNIWPVRSVYWWDKKIVRAGEWMLLCKTNKSKVKKVVARVWALHSYKLPIIETWKTTLFSNQARRWLVLAMGLDKSRKIS